MIFLDLETTEKLRIVADLNELEKKTAIKAEWEAVEEGRKSHATGAYTIYSKSKSNVNESTEGDAATASDVISTEQRVTLLGNFLNLETEEKRQNKRRELPQRNSLEIINLSDHMKLDLAAINSL